MKKFLMILVALFAIGCGSMDHEFYSLKRPIILVAKSKGNTVVVRGSDSVFVTIHYMKPLAAAIGNTYEVGDTLK